MSLRWRWAAALAGVAVVAVAAVGVAAGALLARGLRAEVDRSLLERAETLGRVDMRDLATRFPIAAGRMGRANLLRPLVGPDFEVQILDEVGEVTFAFDDGPRLPVEDIDREIAAGTAPFATHTVTVDGRDFRVVTAPLRSGAVQLARDLAPVETLLRTMTRRLFWVGAASAAAAAAVGWCLAGRAVSPIEKLTRAAERIAETQDLSAPVPSGGPDEVGRLSTSFATMITALDESRRQQQRLVSDAGHELRTPLTGLRTNIEVLRRMPDLSAQQQAELVEAALSEADDLGDLVNELVDLATDARMSPETPVSQPLDEFAAPVVSRYRRLLGRTVQLSGSGGEVEFRPSQFERALSNLIDNAAKWSDTESPIDVVVSGTTLVVRDRGPGIPQEDLPRIFDRFYRAPGARTVPGSGLGLAIVKQAVEANGGTVFARNHHDGGAEVGFVMESPGHST